MPKILVHRGLSEDQAIGALKQDFSEYKRTGFLPAYFGRDARYHWPDAAVKANLFHLHIGESGQWTEWVDQYHRTSDTHLVYCKSLRNDNCYGFLSILRPDAHTQAENMDRMLGLAHAAEAFHKAY